MAIIAKGMITLANVNDAYSVSITPNVCAIKADFDGSNPTLDNAYCDISVLRGDVKVPFSIKKIDLTHTGIEYDMTGDSYNQHFALTSIPVDALSGSITIEISAADDFVANAVFQYSVMREATMLDWIQDWETNKTTIGSTYLITPRLFVGKKVLTEADLSVLTGVYIGPDSDKGAGIYGLKEGVDVFHINEEGAIIGGWAITPGGIQTVDGTLRLLSSGSVVVSDEEENIVWGLYKSGEAAFARGKVKFHLDGSAEFEGKIVSSEGDIAGWTIDESAIWIGDAPANVFGEYTETQGSVTIGTNGLRSCLWRLENDGSGALGGGKINWGSDGTLNVGKWTIDDGIIKSSVQTDSYVHLKAEEQSIELCNNNIQQCFESLDCEAFINATKGGYSSKITLSASNGMIEVSALEAVTNNIIPKTYISPFGIHSNYSGLKANGNAECGHYASIVGIGNASKSRGVWSESGEEVCVVGVYGKAHNTSSAPAYGGYFENLKACGLVLSKRVITDDTSELQVQPNDTLIIGVSSGAKTITLPKANIDGKIVIVQRLGAGDLRVQTDGSSSQSLGVSAVGGTYSLSVSECAIFTLISYKDDSGTLKYVWTIHKLNNSALENA